MMDDKFYAIGIDFGTTYSGVAFAASANPDAIEVITAWDAAHGREKVPSKITFDGRVAGAWGHDIPADVEPLSWFKLLLVDEKNLNKDARGSVHIAAARMRMKEAQQEPIDVVATYLGKLWAYTLDELTKRFGALAVQYTQFKVYLTVPAIWDEAARKLMKKAAIKAGICNDRKGAKATYLELVSEPEAAALAVFNEYKGQHDAKVGDVFIVCDAGGGTVDLVTYEVLGVKPMNIREIVKGDGGMCGAIFIDEQFEAQVKRTLGKRWTQMSPASRKRVVDSQWENGIKRNFDGREQDFTVALPADVFSRRDVILGRKDSVKADMPLKNGQLIVKSGHIKQWFQKSIQQTSHLLRGQISRAEEKDKKPKSILLVGGFGSCKYLFSRLQEEFGAKGIVILQPAGPRGWTAICRGAVIRGLSDHKMDFSGKSQITSRVSRVSYGICYTETFDSAKHLEIDKCWSYEEGVWDAENQMRWYLRVGDDVLDKEPIAFYYYNLLDEDIDNFTLNIYCNREDNPPTRKTEEVAKFVKITVPVMVEFDQLPIHIHATNRTEMRKLSYQVRMVTTGTSMQWEVSVNGVLQGQETLEIEED